MSEMHAVRPTFSHRVTLTLLVAEKEITLLDNGSHDEVYRQRERRDGRLTPPRAGSSGAAPEDAMRRPRRPSTGRQTGGQ